MSPRKHYVLFSSRNPPSIQRIPWPVHSDSGDEDETQKKVWAGYNTWVLNEDKFSWLVEPDGNDVITAYMCVFWLILFVVNVTKILHSRQGVETWLTSDGRTYFVQLHDLSGSEGSASDLGLADDRTVVNIFTIAVCSS